MADQDFISSPNILKPNVVPVHSVLEQDGDYQSELLQEYCPRLKQRIVYYQFYNDGLAPTRRTKTMKDNINNNNNALLRVNADEGDEFLMFIWHKENGVESYTNLHVGNIHKMNIKNINLTIENKIVLKLLHYCGYLMKWLIPYFKVDLLNPYYQLCLENFDCAVLLKKHSEFGLKKPKSFFTQLKKFDLPVNFTPWFMCYMGDHIVNVIGIILEIGLIGKYEGIHSIIYL